MTRNKNKNKKINNLENDNGKLNNSVQDNRQPDNGQLNNSLQNNSLQNNSLQNNTFVSTILMHNITEEEYHNLKQENNELRESYLRITNNERLLQETIHNAKILIEEKDQLKEDNVKLMEENKVLRKNIEELEKKNILFVERVSVLEKDIRELQNRDEPITIREGIVTIEKYIIMNVMGSEFSLSNARRIKGTNNLFKDPSYKTKCIEFLKKHNLTEEHIHLIPELKHSGNISAHNRPNILRCDFKESALLTFDDENDKKMTCDLLKFYETVSDMDKTSEYFIINKPY